jgi:hypothetical protein
VGSFLGTRWTASDPGSGSSQPVSQVQLLAIKHCSCSSSESVQGFMLHAATRCCRRITTCQVMCSNAFNSATVHNRFLLTSCLAPLPLRPALPAGYTPLHMASGYMHTGPMAALLEAGADPLIKDKQGVCRLEDVCGCVSVQQEVK